MKTVFLFLSLVLFSYSGIGQKLEPHSSEYLILKFKESLSENYQSQMEFNRFGINSIDILNKEFGVIEILRTGNRSQAKAFVLKFDKEQNIDLLIAKYLQTDFFEYVEPNYIGRGAGVKGSQSTLPNDFKFSSQWGLRNDGSFNLSPATADADVDMDTAWDIERGDSTLIVAVLDAGLKLDHPEMEGRLWINPFDTVDGADEDNNGYVDDINGWDFANDDNHPKDDHGHGTNVTGIIAAKANNNIGFAGVDWYCKILTGKILDGNNFGLYSWFADGIYYAVDNGARIINMSVGGSGFSQLMDDAVDYAYQNGVTIVTCMMNENNQVTYYPAGLAKTIAVGSTNPNDERSSPFFWSATSGSNFGSHIDVVAPGNYIYGLSHSSNNNYNSYWGGTSQATPLVTGICALLLAQDPLRQPEDLRNILRNTAEDEVGDPSEDIPGFDIYYGAGRVNAFAALKAEAVGREEESSLENGFQIFPNPAADLIFFKSEKDFSKIKVCDALGSVLLEFDKKELAINGSLDVSELSNGIYFICFTDARQTVICTKKLIVEGH